MASSRERFNNIIASENTRRVNARERYEALRVLEHADEELNSAVNFINSGKGNIISGDANADGGTDIRDIVRSKKISAESTEHIDAVNKLRSAYDVLERYAKQQGGGLDGYKEMANGLNEIKEILVGTKQVGEENAKLLTDMISGAYAKRLYREQTEQMFENIDLNSPEIFAKQQQYKQNNPNLYSVMGGRAYNPIPSVNPTQLTKEDLEKVQTAQAADAKYRDPILRQELKDKMDAAKSMYDDFYKGENDLQTFLNKIGGVGGGEEARDKYKKKYEDAAADYYSLTVGNEEMRKQRISELEREVGILQIKMRENPQSKKSLESQLDEVRAELNGLRTSLYGKVTIGEYVGAHALAGADSVSTGVYNTLGLIIGKPLEWIGWKDNPVLKLKEFTQKNHERLQNEALLASKAMGDDYNVGGMLIQGVVAAIPDAALAFATAGTSKAVQLGTKAPGFFAALSRTATNMAKNPMFWSSYVRTLGNDYDSAIEDGASPEAAFIYAQLTSTLNAVVEIGGETGHGGIQTLPDALKNAGKNKSAILEWVTSSLDEGKEEVIQSVISDLNARIIYNSDKKPDIGELAKEGAMGIVVGGILGGGQISANMILNADTRAEYKQIGEVALRQEDFEGIISYARKSVDTDIRALALSSTPQNISAENAGLLYSYVYKDITAAIASPAESATARQNFIDIMRENDSATVQALAGSRYIIRMSEDPQIGEMPTIDNINTESVIDNEENADLQSTSNEVLQTGENDDIIEIRGDSDEFDNRGRALESVEEIRRRFFTQSGHEEDKRSIRESYEAFSERTSNTDERSGEKTKRIVRIGKTALAFTPSEADTPLRRFVEELNKIGIEAYCCEGNIESNSNGITTIHSEAVTASGGRIFFCENSSLSNKEKADHELIHHSRRILDDAFLDYDEVVMNNLKTNSNYYIALCEELNEREFNNKFEEKNFFDTDEFFSELEAYLYQKVLNNPTFAEEFFSNMFTDWDAVKAAVFEFNGKMKIDTSVLSEATSAEAASSFAQNESSGDKGETELTKLNTENTKRRHTNRAEQEYLTGVGKDLSVSVVHEDIEKVLTAQGYKLDGNIPDGYIDENGVIHIGFNVVNPTKFILKHELVHYGRGTEGYKNYTDAIDKTKAFKEWLQKKTGAKTDSIGELKGLYRDKIKRTRGKLAPKSTTKLNEEMYADFSGEVVFTTSSFEQLIKQVNSKDRSAIIQFVLDFLSFLKDKLSGKKGITFEIKRLESKYSSMLREATKTTHTAEGEGLRFSVSKSFEEQIDDVINGEHNPRWDIYVSETPKVFTDLGFSKSPLLMRNSKVKEILNKHSEMTVEKIKLIPKAIQEPILVLKSKTHPTESVVAITDIQTEKGEMIIPVWINQEGNYLDLEIGEEIVENTNFVATAYGRNIKSLLEYAHENNGFLYQSSDIEKVRQLLARNGLQLPTPLKLSDSDITISQEDSIVNTNSTQKDEKYTESGEKDFSIPTIEDEAVDTDEDVSDRDIVSETERLSDEYNSGRISLEEYRERLQELWDEAHETYGAHPRGENAKADIPVPRKVAKNKPVERFVRTVIEADVLTEDMLEDIETDILLGNFSYEMISDEKAQNYAKEKMAARTAERDWIAAFEKGTVSKNDLAVGEMLLKDAIERDDRLRVLELSAELSDMFTRAGQMVQAARMFKKMTGAGRVVTVQRNIKTLNKSLEEKYGDNFGKNKKIKPIQLDPTLATQLTEAQTQEDVETVMKDVTESIANQVPATWLDKLNAWRYFAMLANPRTHIRNIIGNLVFTPVIVIKNTVAAGTERVAQLIVKDENGRTKSVVIKKEYRDFAARDVKKQEAQLMLQGTGQLDAKGQIAQMQRTFETEWLEKITKGNSNLLESEDMLFKSTHYKIALAGYLQAQGVDLKSIDSKTLDKAREYAVKEAKKATFQDASFIAEMLNKSFRIPKGSKWEGNRGAEAASLIARFAVEGILPFKRTPINIIKRGIEYSPAGLAKACTLGIYDVVKGKITVSEFCDGLAAGLTGTGIMLIGMWLNSLGLINGGFGDDEEDKFKQLNGEQEYSVKILGKSYSIDWAAPACLPLFIGTELMQELSRDGLQIRDIGDVVWNTLEPITNLSMLSGIQGLIDAVKYEDGSKTIATMAGDMATSFAMQFVPSAFGALARTVDPTQRTWYTDKNSQFDEFLQGAGNNLASKIPGLSYIQAASIDAWGRERSRGGTVERIAENFVSPGYFTEIDYDNTAKELERLYKSTGENVFPKVATKSFEVDSKTKHLTAKEWEKYAKTKGQQSYAYIHEFTESKAYEGLTDGERAKVITNLYKLANAKAKAEVSDYDLDKQFKSVTRYEKNGGSAVTYYIYRALSD